MRTLKIWHAFVLFAGMSLALTSCNKKDDEIKLDFEITVPEDWNYYVLNQGNFVYYASSPLENSTDSITEDLLITREKITGVTLDPYYAALIDNLEEDTSYHMIYTTDTTINGTAAKKFIHLQTLFATNASTLDTLELHAKILKFAFARNNYGYVVSFNALDDTFDDYKAEFDEIMSSFKFIN